MPEIPEPTRIIPPYIPPVSGGVTDHGALTGLGDDDHTQYHTDARALTWVNTITGSVLQAWDQDLQDIADITTPSTGDLIRWNGANWVNYPDSNYASSSHGSTHISGGSDEVDGDQLDIDWNPTNYTPATNPTEVTSLDHLTAHLYGIDQALAAAGTTDHTALSNLSWTVSDHTGGANQVAYFDGTGAASGDAGFTYDGNDLTVNSITTTDTSDAIDITGSGQLRIGSPGVYIRQIANNGHMYHKVNSGDQFRFACATIDFILSDDKGYAAREKAAITSQGAGWGSFWVRNDAPNVPMFTDDTGTDYVLAYSGSAHASTHISGGGDEIDGDQLDIDWNPTNYTPATTPAEVTSVDHLTAHLYGIDQGLGNAGDVSGQGSSTDNALVRWDGATGTSIQDSGVLLDDTDNMTFPNNGTLFLSSTGGQLILGNSAAYIEPASTNDIRYRADDQYITNASDIDYVTFNGGTRTVNIDTASGRALQCTGGGIRIPDSRTYEWGGNNDYIQAGPTNSSGMVLRSRGNGTGNTGRVVISTGTSGNETLFETDGDITVLNNKRIQWNTDTSSDYIEAGSTLTDMTISANNDLVLRPDLDLRVSPGGTEVLQINSDNALNLNEADFTLPGIALAADTVGTNSMVIKSILTTETTTVTPKEMSVSGSSATSLNTFVLPDQTTWLYEAWVVARRTDADGESAGYILRGVIDRNTGAASTALVGSVSAEYVNEDTAAWDVTAKANATNGSLEIEVTGENSKTIRWTAYVIMVAATG